MIQFELWDLNWVPFSFYKRWNFEFLQFYTVHISELGLKKKLLVHTFLSGSAWQHTEQFLYRKFR